MRSCLERGAEMIPFVMALLFLACRRERHPNSTPRQLSVFAGLQATMSTRCMLLCRQMSTPGEWGGATQVALERVVSKVDGQLLVACIWE
jgi:hypothetical protein